MIRKKTTDVILLVLAAATAVGITICAVRFAKWPSALIIMPLYISIVITFLSARVSRFAFLLGAINSLFYAAAYIYFTLYLTAAYAVLFSCPVQFLTFVRWKKKDNDGETIFHEMSAMKRIAVVAGFVVCYFAFYTLLKYIGSDYGFYDTFSMLSGILVTLLCAVPYIEYIPLQLAGVTIGLPMYAQMASTEPIKYTYLIYQAYCLICVVVATVRIFRIYAKQKAGK